MKDFTEPKKRPVDNKIVTELLDKLAMKVDHPSAEEVVDEVENGRGLPGVLLVLLLVDGRIPPPFPSDCGCCVVVDVFALVASNC